ncbi:MAG: GntR family transcriptional regulator [Thermoplasmatales archaeon]
MNLIMNAKKTAKSNADFTESYRVFIQIRELIMSGEYLPGEKLTEQYISDLFNTSRYTVKIALSKIEEEGLVKLDPYKGYTVAKIDLAESIELLEARALIEGLIGRIAAVKITENEIRKLREILQDMRNSVEEKDFHTYSKLNTLFHETIYAATKNNGLLKVVSNLKTRVIRYQYKVAYIPGRTPKSLEEHERILNALENHDSEKASEAMQKHVLSVKQTIEEYHKLLEVV